MILYIHGFASSGDGAKARIFREYYRKMGVAYLAPSLSFIPELAIATLEEIIKNCDDVKLIGSSLGGYYANFLAKKFDIKAVLINPSITPQETLKRTLGEVECFYANGGRFCWEEKHLKILEQYRITNPHVDNLLLLSQKGDETLDYKEGVHYLEGAKMIVEDGGSHSFDGIARHFETIDDFLGVQ